MSLHRWVLSALAVPLLLGLAACGDNDDRTADPGPSPTSTDDPTDGATESLAEAEVLEETADPEGCTVPASDAAEETLEVVYGMGAAAADDTVTLELLSTSTDGDAAELRVERRTPDCTGTARVVVPPGTTLEVLGLSLESSATGPWQPTPNRAAATVTLIGGGAR